jgi:acetyltransferase-like isoleucine patch superfamily enzyme
LVEKEMSEEDWSWIPDWVLFDVIGGAPEIHPSVKFIPVCDEPWDCSKTFIGNRVKIDAGAVIYGGVHIGNDSVIGHNTILRPRVKVGIHCLITNGCILTEDVTVGNHVAIHHLSHLAQQMYVEDYVFIGPNLITSNENDIPYYRKGYVGRGKKKHFHAPIICYGARIAGGVRILPNVIIRNYAFVGVGAVVTKDVEQYAVVYGVPAKVHRYLDRKKEKIIPCKIDHGELPWK